MPSYVETTLTKDEKLLYSAKVSPYMLGQFLLTGLILMLIYLPLGFLVWLIGLVLFLTASSTTELGITNKRLIAKFGLISRDTIELNLSKIESVQVKQGIFGRALNYGTIIVRGTGGTPTPIPNISDPIAFRKTFSTICEEMDLSRSAAAAHPAADSINRAGKQSDIRMEQGLQGDAVFCSECGVRSSAMASFCSGCGNKIERMF